jgi:hypothetical protein
METQKVFPVGQDLQSAMDSVFLGWDFLILLLMPLLTLCVLLLY